MKDKCCWAMCKCFFERNIFLTEIGHVTFKGLDQFRSKYEDILSHKDADKIIEEIRSEIGRRRLIHKTKEINRVNTLDKYKPLDVGLFSNDDFFAVSQIKKGLQMLPDVYSFPFLSPDQCNALLSAVNHFKQAGLDYQRPTSMNKSGVLLEELGLNPQINNLVKAVESFAKEKFPDLVGKCGLDSFKAFTVEYNAQGADPCDIERATHFDNAEVTLNIPLTDDHDGSELYFQTKGGFRPVEMSVGRAILHSGRRQHGVLPITEGYRCNLIVWMRSSEIRNRICPMCNETPDLEEIEYGQGDGFTVTSENS